MLCIAVVYGGCGVGGCHGWLQHRLSHETCRRRVALSNVCDRAISALCDTRQIQRSGGAVTCRGRGVSHICDKMPRDLRKGCHVPRRNETPSDRGIAERRTGASGLRTNIIKSSCDENHQAVNSTGSGRVTCSQGMVHVGSLGGSHMSGRARRRSRSAPSAWRRNRRGRGRVARRRALPRRSEHMRRRRRLCR